ncbi:hypothetical protein PWT90_08157 [Aphanocladium album]|nr:hypothetical protein PWT90_08157 [Aphanocladium album]
MVNKQRTPRNNGSVWAPAHIQTLMRYAIALGVKGAAFRFAEALARGLRDVVIVLLEPLEYFQATTLAEGIAASHTLQEIDRFLKQASNGRRNLANTAVFDVRVFLTAQMRTRMTPQEVATFEERSFAVFQQMVEELNPAVVLTCQCATANARNELVRLLSSTFPPAPDLGYVQICGRRVPVLRAFHPAMYKEQRIQQWAGPDREKQEQCRKILTTLLMELFWEAFHMDNIDDAAGWRKRRLLEQFRRLRLNKAPSKSQGSKPG